jgi:hypothetical protein
MTLYKHGVGFFERRAELSGEQVALSFRVEEMNDILKSLTVIDWGEGQVLGVDYATPQSVEERLAGTSIRLADDRSMRDLLISLRGRRVRLHLDQSETVKGTLLGLDEVAERQPVATSLVSLLMDDTDQVQVVDLGRLQALEIIDPRGAEDLRFFLRTSLSQENYREVMIRLTPGQHDLSVSYIAPAPTWRVSYRLVLDDNTGGETEESRSLLQGWGIFDNRLEEDLEDISLRLMAGMPISFIYDLYTPFLPERPLVEEEERVAPGPVDFAAAEPTKSLGLTREAFAVAAPAPQRKRSIEREALEDAAKVTTEGEVLGELFQYVIGTPVTVGRGQSAMVPIIASDLGYRKDLLYNGSKMPAHPVATLRLDNETGLTLERGPVTVLEGGTYAGEAVLPFTGAGREIAVPYAVELGVKVREESGSRKELHGLRIEGVYLQFEEWDVRWREYQLNNSTNQNKSVLVECLRSPHYELFDTPDPLERTDEHWRFQLLLGADEERTLRVQERRLVRRREELLRQSYKGLQRYLRRGLIDRQTHDRIAELLKLQQQIANNERRLKKIEQQRQKIYVAQQQIQGNMNALSNTGKEGSLRARYVEQLEDSEQQLAALAREETQLEQEISRLQQEIEAELDSLAQ